MTLLVPPSALTAMGCRPILTFGCPQKAASDRSGGALERPDSVSRFR